LEVAVQLKDGDAISNIMRATKDPALRRQAEASLIELGFA